ncbi:hypothetical protein EfsSVR2331_05210 [Enterococcus faecalis]|nr:hypothetical protein EfsSVR2331_05210 [Enterococcus faecalis]
MPASGYAAYIGKDVETFIRQFGNPKEKIKTGRTYELWTFGLTMNDYLEVNVRENKVIAIKAFNNDKMIEPFKIDMKLADLSDLMTIYSNFAFNFHHEAYDVELMEEDMNYRPLVAFDNGSFAVLFF